VLVTTLLCHLVIVLPLARFSTSSCLIFISSIRMTCHLGGFRAVNAHVRYVQHIDNTIAAICIQGQVFDVESQRCQTTDDATMTSCGQRSSSIDVLKPMKAAESISDSAAASEHTD